MCKISHSLFCKYRVILPPVYKKGIVMTGKQNSKGFILVFLGMLSAFGPFVMDMYLPTLPAMSDFFQTTSSRVQLGLTTSMVGLAIGQLIFGPLSDKYGRRSPLLVAMALFLVSTVGCIFSRNISQFVALRFVQGVAGAGGVVISRSIATDKYAAHELAGMLATIGAINGIATVVAPIGGGALADFGGWHGIFWFLFILGSVLIVGCMRFRESLPGGQRQNIKCRDMYRRFSVVLHNRQYVRYILQYGFTMGVLFTNIASAPFIMQQHYGLSPMLFSVCFGVNAIAMVISSALAVRFSTMERALHVGNNGMLLISIVLFAAFFLNCNFWVYEVLIFCLLSMVGMTFTASNTLAMDCERRNAGVASALLGAMGFAFGGVVSALAGMGDIRMSAGFLFIMGSLCSCMCTGLSFHRFPFYRKGFRFRPL